MKRHAAPILAAILLLLPVLYVGSYLALVLPEGRKVSTEDKSYWTFYRVDGQWPYAVFWPAQELDRHLVRPTSWDDDWDIRID